MAFSSGLSVPTMSMHHPARQTEVDREKQRERCRMKPKLPRAAWTPAPIGTRVSGGAGWGDGASRFLLLPPPPPPQHTDAKWWDVGGREERGANVLLKRVEGH